MLHAGSGICRMFLSHSEFSLATAHISVHHHTLVMHQNN